MSSAVELQGIIERWAKEPDLARIRHALTTSMDRHHLATMCLAADIPLPDDLVDLVLELIDADQLMQEVLDALMGAATDPWTRDARLPARFATLILERPDGHAFQGVLADFLVAALFDEETDSPTQVKERLADVCCELVAALPHPAFAPVFLARALTAEDPQVVSRALRECWERAELLDDEDLYLISVDVADLVDVDIDPEVALAAAGTALRLEPEHETSDADPERTAYLHLVLVEALARTDRLAAVDRAESAMSQDPALENSPVAESWARNLFLHLSDLARQDAPSSLVLGLADRLASRRDRWPVEDDSLSLFGVVLARIYLAGNAPERARPWVYVAFEHPADVQDYEAEVAMLRVNVALQLGHTEELDALLRESAQAVADATDDEYRVAWGAATEALARVNRDRTLAGTANRGQAGVVSDLAGPLGGYPADALRAKYAFSQELMEVHERFVAGEATAEVRDAAAALCRRIPPGQPQLFIGAHMYACATELSQGNLVEAERHLDQLSAEIQRQRVDPAGGFPIVIAEQTESLFRLLTIGDVTDWSGDRTARLRQLRDDNEAAGRAHLAYLMTRALMVQAAKCGNFAAATDEGIRALSFHARRAVATPDARERAALREAFGDVAEATFRAAIAAGWPRVAAEVLEVVRAQPVPLARLEVPRAEQSLMGMVTELFSQSPLSEPQSWSGTWSAAGDVAPAPQSAGRPPVEETALVLTGLPSILMPWGAALQDRLRDVTCHDSVRVVVSRGAPGC
ncbi:MAG: hypothetical protein WAR57_08775 [Candidatus Phosphoribacter sp.]